MEGRIKSAYQARALIRAMSMTLRPLMGHLHLRFACSQNARTADLPLLQPIVLSFLSQSHIHTWILASPPEKPAWFTPLLSLATFLSNLAWVRERQHATANSTMTIGPLSPLPPSLPQPDSTILQSTCSDVNPFAFRLPHGCWCQWSFGYA